MKKCILIAFMLVFPGISMVYAQEVTVSGTVSSSQDGSTLPGVSVVIKGTQQGTVTDINGKYSIKAEASSTLVFSFIGMETREEAVGGRSTIDILLSPTVQSLEEVVVVGYGTESRKLLTSSISDFKPKDINEIPLENIDAAIQGKATGVQVVQNSGTPGGGMTVRIRGNNSINAGNEPLYVIDGIPMLTGNFGQIGFSGQNINAISDLNPNDIESISILKDASATSIYGARASNGVVLITTKRGKVEKTNINFSAYGGFQMAEKKLDMLDASEWMVYRNELKANEGAPPVYSQEEIDNPPVDTDWLDEVFRTGALMNYELSATGGNEKTTFYISGGYSYEDGILIGTDFKRLNGRLNLDHNLTSRLKIGTGIGLSNSWNNRVEGDQSLNGPLPNAISLPPVYPVYNSDGSYNEDGPYANPVAIANEASNLAQNFRTIANIFANYRILEGLNFETKWGIDYLSLNEHSYDPMTTRQGSKYNGLGIEGNTIATNFTTNNFFTYAKTFRAIHELEAMAGYSYERYVRKSSYIEATEFPNEYFQYITSAANIRTATASKVEDRTNSFFGRVKYNLKNRYIITLSGRYDGSSKFGKNNKYGFFPAISAAWRVSEEEFFAPVSFVNDLKLRVSYGYTGNDGIPRFSSPALYSGGANYGGYPGTYPVQIPNPDIRWESTAQFDAGFDLEVVNSRIRLVFDYYYAKTTDLLLDRPVSATSGFAGVIDNIGELENKGFEIGLSTDNIKAKDFTWTSVLNFSRNRNKILKLYNGQPIDNLGRGSNYIGEGEPFGIFYGYHSLGVDPSTGDIVFEDVNGDGVITSEDRKKIGDPNPDFYGGFSNVFTYKQLSLNVFLQFSYGNDIYNGTRVYIESLKGDDNQLTTILDRWQQPGDETDIPRATMTDPNNNNRTSSRFIEDGSYLRIKEVILSYAFSKELTRKLGLSGLKIFATAYNLFTFTNYSGMDPEVNYAGGDNLRLGTDFFTYPQARKFIFGINIGI
ncbi:MAG: TonB-dependent receptor [Bacteroidetes bacterium]|nr:TonB-dependent receptor [Bacteroidota bacterium]